MQDLIKQVMNVRRNWTIQDFNDSYSDEWDEVPTNIEECFEMMKDYLETYDEELLEEIISDEELIPNLVTDANILSVELKLPYFTNVADMFFDMGLLELECGGRKFVTDSYNTTYFAFNMTVNVTFKVDEDICSDYKQDLLVTDLFSDDLSVDFYIGCEYTIEPEVRSLFVRDNGSTKVIEFN